MPICSFCKKNYNLSKGTTVVQKDASVRYFCSSKCRKNMEMGRFNKKVKWVRKSDLVKNEKAKKQAAYEARQKILEAEKTEKAAKKATKKSAKKATKK
jgi:large subunit ribosomal protein L24e